MYFSYNIVKHVFRVNALHLLYETVLICIRYIVTLFNKNISLSRPTVGFPVILDGCNFLIYINIVQVQNLDTLQ